MSLFKRWLKWAVKAMLNWHLQLIWACKNMLNLFTDNCFQNWIEEKKGQQNSFSRLISRKSLLCVLLYVKLLLLWQTSLETCPIPELTGFQANFYYLNLGEAINKKAPASYIAYIMKFNVFLSAYQHIHTQAAPSNAIDFYEMKKSVITNPRQKSKPACHA